MSVAGGRGSQPTSADLSGPSMRQAVSQGLSAQRVGVRARLHYLSARGIRPISLLAHSQICKC
eukprot:3349142-Alexandrium_andersonii.AAC.2